MKKLIIAIILTTFSCSVSDKRISSQTLEFIESSGSIKLVIKGSEWESIESTASSGVNSDNPHDIELAMVKATLRAKANISEFIVSRIETKKESLSKSNLNISDSDKNQILSEISETIKSDSSSILRGSHVVERKLSDDRRYVFVRVRAEKNVSDIVSKWKN